MQYVATARYQVIKYMKIMPNRFLSSTKDNEMNISKK